MPLPKLIAHAATAATAVQSWLSPRRAPTAHARYDGAGYGRRLIGWVAPSTGPNAAQSGQPTLRNRARDLARNDWIGAAIGRVLTTNLIGTGIIPRSKVRAARQKQRFAEIWADFVAHADADGVLDFYGLQALAVDSMITSGEAFIRLRPRRLTDGLRVPLQLQLIESDQVALFDADAWAGLPSGHRIRSGIELDALGHRTAYWCYRVHPGDAYPGHPGAGMLSRVPATHMLHLYRPLRAGALRGIPEIAPVLAKVRGVCNFDDAVLHRQELANLFSMFITQAQPEALFGAAGTAPGDPPPVPHEPPPIALGPGAVNILNPGDSAEFSTPPGPGADYADYMRQQHLGIAAAVGIPYELLTGDIRDISDRTLRVQLNEFRRMCEQRQWHTIIPQLCQPVRKAVADAAVLAGQLTVAEAPKFTDCVWAPPAWPYIHPTQDVESRRLEVEAGFKSRSQIIAERGEEPEDIDAERAEDAARARRLNLMPPGTAEEGAS